MRIALFGTSADPPTAGHQTILKWLSERYDLVAVWAADNPFKLHQTSLEHRYQMLRLTIEEIKPNKNNIDLYEQLSHKRSLITVEKAKDFFGEEHEFILVVGSDLIKQLPHWYRAQELLAQVQLLIIPRPGYLINPEDLRILISLGGKYTLANLETPAISSTAYRLEGDINAIVPAVKKYIKREGLYVK